MYLKFIFYLFLIIVPLFEIPLIWMILMGLKMYKSIWLHGYLIYGMYPSGKDYSLYSAAFLQV